MGLRSICPIAILILLMLPAGSLAATTIEYSDNFEANTSSNYTVNADPDSLANFAYDYSAMGIPSAPNSTGGTTRGLRFKANAGDATGAPAAINISPTSLSLSGNYTMRFDLWLNTNGPFPTGGNGSTTFFSAGVGTAGASIQKSSGPADGTWFAADTDGNIGVDYRAYLNTTLQSPTTGFYAAGSSTSPDSRSADDSYYHSAFPGGQEPPTFQQLNYPSQQSGPMKPGALAFAWRNVEIARTGSTVTWSIDGLLIASISSANFSGNNVFVGYWDPFISISDPNLNFAVIDNFEVSTVPEPASASAIAIAVTLLAARRRRCCCCSPRTGREPA